MDTAGYMSLELVNKLTEEIQEKYEKLFRRVTIPHNNEDQATDNRVFSIGFGE